MSAKEDEKSFGDLPTLGHEETERAEVTVGDGPSWTALGLSEVETLKPGEGIRDDGQTDGVRRWKSGEEILGRYVVERELGQGGMGVVYGCLDKVGGVKVAVKCLPPELSHNSVEMEEVRENFELVYKLNHPNIAAVKTLERNERGKYFLVMDVAEGENLRAWLRRKWKAGGVTLAEAVPILRQVASALDYAHGKKVVHRDVKPGNVVIDARTGEVKVLDFGLAAQIRTSLSRASHAYRGTSGTGPYMAPEQWLAKQQDGAADQYALGVMAYEMLAGHLPFENSELAVLKDAVLHGTADPVPGLRKGAMAALRQAMAKRQEERFRSCGEFVEALAGERRRGGGGWRNARGKPLFGWVAALWLVVMAAGAWWGGWGRENSGGTPAPRQATAAHSEDSFQQQDTAQLEAEKRSEEEVKRKLEETVYQLAAEAKSKTAAATGYDRGQGFGDRLDEALSKLHQGEAAIQGRNFEKAKEWLEESLSAAKWLEENEALREESIREAHNAEESRKTVVAMDGEELNVPSYQRGNERRMEGTREFENARFKAATLAWNEAGKAYALAATEARDEKLRQGLEAAYSAKGLEAWDEVVTAAEGVLELDSGNAEAKHLKDEATGKLKPSILLKATLGGQEVFASVKEPIAGKGRITPVRVSVPKGGSYDFVLEYATAGKRYEGRKTVLAEAFGTTEASVALEEVKENEAGRTKTIMLPGGAAMEMVWCPPGSFWMGSPLGEEGRGDNETRHQVTLTEGFWMAKYEVTQAQWKSVMGSTVRRQLDTGISSGNIVVYGTGVRIEGTNAVGPVGLYGEGDNYPMYHINWDDCQEFCRKCQLAGVDLRLPTEAQWEYACRAGSTTAVPNGYIHIVGKNNAPALDEIAWYGGNSSVGWMGVGGEDTSEWPEKQYPGGKAGVHPVGGKKPNKWGLYDMIGNVWEWCQDWLGGYPTNAVTNPTGPDPNSGVFLFRIARGGSWFGRTPVSNLNGGVESCRSAMHTGFPPTMRLKYMGFRPICISP